MSQMLKKILKVERTGIIAQSDERSILPLLLLLLLLLRYTASILDLDLDDNRQCLDGYYGNGVCTPTGFYQSINLFCSFSFYGVSTFTPRSISISNAMFTRSLLAACYLACSLASLAAVQYGT